VVKNNGHSLLIILKSYLSSKNFNFPILLTRFSCFIYNISLPLQRSKSEQLFSRGSFSIFAAI